MHDDLGQMGCSEPEPPDCGCFLCRWPDGVVPLAVELVASKWHRRQRLVSHLDAKRVAAAVQLQAR
jgi:hypothetical protein